MWYLSCHNPSLIQFLMFVVIPIIHNFEIDHLNWSITYLEIKVINNRKKWSIFRLIDDFSPFPRKILQITESHIFHAQSFSFIRHKTLFTLEVLINCKKYKSQVLMFSLEGLEFFKSWNKGLCFCAVLGSIVTSDKRHFDYLLINSLLNGKKCR